MKALILCGMIFLILPGCEEKKFENEIDRLDITSVNVKVMINDSIVEDAEIDKHFKIVLSDPDKIAYFRPTNKKVTLPVFDTVPNFRISYKDYDVQFMGGQATAEGKFIFNRKVEKLIVSIDTYPFNSLSVQKFKNRKINTDNYFMFLSSNVGWNFNVCEKKHLSVH